MKNPLTELDIFDLANQSQPLVQKKTEYIVLRYLLDSPEFKLKTYHGQNSEHFNPPPAVVQLPSGEENITLQYLLGTVNIPEASYEDNGRLINEWFKQLGWNNPGEQMKLAMTKIVAWCGDQLTMDRLRGLDPGPLICNVRALIFTLII